MVKRIWFVKLLSFFLALVLGSWPLPPLIGLWRPDWVMLVLIYWALHPLGQSLSFTFVLGLLLDVQTGTPMGVHTLSLCIVVWAAAQYGRRTRVFSLWQTSTLVAVLAVIFRGVNWLVLNIVSYSDHDVLYVLPVLSSALAWPMLVVLMRRYGGR
ncbi:MAG: rod shape-determining protein MreD [Pseudomonadales bacterium]|nr:rod shape-determining protein MreD [Pseudomonadales bacterium]